MKKTIGLMATFILATAILAGCGKNSSTSTSELEVKESAAEEKTEAATLSKINPVVSTEPSLESNDAPAAPDMPGDEITFTVENVDEESDVAEDDPTPSDELREDDPVPVKSESNNPNPKANWRDYYNGSVFNLDEYVMDLGFTVCFSETDRSGGLSYYNITKGGIEYCIMNSRFTMDVMYADDDSHWYVSSLAESYFNNTEGIIVEAANQEAEKMTEEWIDNLATALVFIASQDNWFELDDIPVVGGHYIGYYEGSCYYDFSGTLYTQPGATTIKEYKVK